MRKFSSLRQYTFIVSVSMLQESRHSLAESSASVSLKDSNQSVSPGAAFSSEGWTGERSSPKLTHMVGGKIQFLSGYWTKGFNSLQLLAECYRQSFAG